jgi:PAS domain S-box-containing protein
VSFVTSHDVDQILERASGKVVGLACALVLLNSSLVLAGWLLADSRIIHYPVAARYGTMMPLTAAALLLFSASLWLLRDESDATTGPRVLGKVLAAMPMIFGTLFLWEYARGVDLGIDRLLFPQTVTALVDRLPGRPAPISAFSFIPIGLALLCLDLKSRTVQRVCELLMLLVILLAFERCVSYLYREIGMFASRWRVFGHPFLQPMSPPTALCFITLSIGLFYARPQRHNGLLALFYTRGPAHVLTHWIMPFAVIAPIFFGWLGLLAFRAGLRGTVYPLSLVVSSMIVLFLLVIILNARAMDRTDQQRVRAERTLAARERLQRAVFDNAGAGLIVVDTQGRLVTSNRTIQAMVGYSADELASMSLWRFTHPADVALNHALFEQLVRGDIESYFIKTLCPRKDGSEFAGELNTSVARGSAGRAEFVIGMIQDVTKRKESEEARERLGAIVEATPDFVGIADPAGQAVYINEAGRKLLGHSAAGIANLTIPDLHAADDRQRVLQDGIPTAIRNGVWTGETRLKTLEGTLIPVSHVILAHKTKHGELAYLSTIMRDITYRKRLEFAQQFLLDISRACTGSMDTDTILRSLVGLVVPRHADYCAIYLLAPEGSIEKTAIARTARGPQNIVELVRVHAHAKKPNPLIADVARTGKAVIMPVVRETDLQLLLRGTRHMALLRKIGLSSVMALPLQGRERVLGVLCYLRTEPGKPFEGHRVALAQEVAGRLTLALDNASLLVQAQEATRIRDEVLRVVAHDLRNPLNTISLTADYLRQRPASAVQADWAGRLEIIMRSVVHADRLIQDLLDVARLEAGLLTVETRPTVVRSVVDEVMQMLQPQAEDRTIQLRSEIDASLSAVQADASRIMQVLSNLLGNAIKFSPAGSDVMLRVLAEPGKVCFSVQDHGAGIADRDRAHLFDPFWQARRGKQGVGLGLPIAKAIVEAHDGALWFESERGVGSTFYFTLPVSQPHADNSVAAD